MAGERVLVTTRSDGDQPGVIRQRWHGPVSGSCYVVDLDDGRWIIAPVATVRRQSESETA